MSSCSDDGLLHSCALGLIWSQCEQQDGDKLLLKETCSDGFMDQTLVMFVVREQTVVLKH